MMIWAGVICGVVAALYWAMIWMRRETGWAGSAVKTLSVAGLALTGALTGALSGAPGLIVAGLALGAAGDFALSRPGQPAFLAGMAAFAAGHLAYSAAFWGWAGSGVSFGQLLALAFLAALIQSTETWLAPRTGSLKPAVRGYVGIIGIMAALTLFLAPRAGTPWVQAGAALFVASDLTLALRMFVVTDARVKAGLNLAVWPAYWVGQALILWGAMQMG